MPSFPTVETTFLLKGPVGNIEVCAAPAAKASKTAVICHPHPLYGGTMHNKVVTTLVRAFHELGLHAVRFNFRGVGKTEGTHDLGHGEIDDLLAVAEWAQWVCPQNALWLAGFSFGGFVAASGATHLAVSQLISIAPQVSRFLSEGLPAITCPWLMIQGDQDDIVPLQEVLTWVATLQPQPHLVRLPTAGHFFHGQLGELRQILVRELQTAALK